MFYSQKTLDLLKYSIIIINFRCQLLSRSKTGANMQRPHKFFKTVIAQFHSVHDDDDDDDDDMRRPINNDFSCNRRLVSG